MQQLLQNTNYDRDKSNYLVKGFTEGFKLEFQGNRDWTEFANNLPLRIGDNKDLWNKVIKEVGEDRYAGPYELHNMPFSNFIQSLIGLVPKANGKTRLIFHLSYEFGADEDQLRQSVNSGTPLERCKVKYNDLDHAVANCLKQLEFLGKNGALYFAKSDCSNAFRVAPIYPKDRALLVMSAVHPTMKIRYFFIDMCLPFGASISCAIFQVFSDAIKFITDFYMKLKFSIPPGLTNYLDNFLFIVVSLILCDEAVGLFLDICDKIGCPISMEKTEYADCIIVFLGVLLNGKEHFISIPLEKIIKATNLLLWAIKKRKAKIKFIQQITGTLNFLQKAIVPG